MDDDTLKKQFALALATVPGDPFKAACIVFPDDITMACRKAVEWNNDPEVLEEIEKLKNCSIPSRNEAAELAWEIATNGNELGKDRVAALKLFAEINNYMPDKTINKNINVAEVKVNKVMAYKDFGEIDEWEKSAIEQQRILKNG